MQRANSRDRLEVRRSRLERHAAESDPDVVLNAAARYLETRSRSIQEVRCHLATARYPEDLVEAAIARLLELGVLDDAAFARVWVELRDRTRPRGTGALRRELALKGIDRGVIAEALANRDTMIIGDADRDSGAASADEIAAEHLLDKNRASLGRIDDTRVRRQRAYSLLARNGFDPEVCREVSARMVAPAADHD